jgi:hypothetical protein
VKRTTIAALLAAAAVIVLTAGGVAAGCGGTESPATVAQDFWAAASDQDSLGVYALVDASAPGAPENGAAALRLIQTAQAKVDAAGSEYSTGSASISGATATAPTTASGSGGTLKFSTVLNQFDGAWKVDVAATAAELEKATKAAP